LNIQQTYLKGDVARKNSGPVAFVKYLALTTDHLQITVNTHIHLTASSPGQTGEAGTRKDKPIWILMQQETMGRQWHQLHHMQIVYTLLQADNHDSISTLIFFYKLDVLTDVQPTVSQQ